MPPATPNARPSPRGDEVFFVKCSVAYERETHICMRAMPRGTKQKEKVVGDDEPPRYKQRIQLLLGKKRAWVQMPRSMKELENSLWEDLKWLTDKNKPSQCTFTLDGVPIKSAELLRDGETIRAEVWIHGAKTPIHVVSNEGKTLHTVMVTDTTTCYELEEAYLTLSNQTDLGERLGADLALIFDCRKLDYPATVKDAGLIPGCKVAVFIGTLGHNNHSFCSVFTDDI